MLDWLKRILKRSHETPPAAGPARLPKSWEAILRHRLALYVRLPESSKPTLHKLMREFIDQKQFWGAEGLVVTEEMKVLVAAQACILLLNLPRFWLYPRTKEVILYPGDFGEVAEAIGPDGRRYIVTDDKIGETWNRGPVALAWNNVRRAGWIDRDGHNVVFHEFAHALDWLSGAADGAPPMENDEQLRTWRRVCTEEYNALVFADRNGRRAFLDTYGATNPAEFFAVATEQFFEEGRRFQRLLPALYAQLKRFYGQDPAAWN